MSKRIGYYKNADFSALNINDSEINSGVLNGCKIIFYTNPISSPSNAVVSLNTSDPTEPRLMKSDINSDKKDNYIFNIISNKTNTGYMIQSSIGGWYLTANPHGAVSGTKNISGVWRFVQMDGKSNIRCKLQLVTTDNKKAYLAEKAPYINVVPSEDASNTQWNIGFVSFGPTAFEKLLKNNNFLKEQCCQENLPANLKSICKTNKLVEGTKECKGFEAPYMSHLDISQMQLDVTEEENYDDGSEEEENYDDGEERVLTISSDKMSTTEIILGIGIIVLIGISIYMITKKK